MNVVILGAGVAGLSTAYFLKQMGLRPLVLEKGDTPGGLARSFCWNGFTCDFAAHRFFTDDLAVLRQVEQLTPLLTHRRRSLIRLGGKWMRDPIDVVELGRNLPLAKSGRLLTSYLRRDASLSADSFESFVVGSYGRGLYEAFFRGYTERLLGLPGDQISVEWARRKVRLASPLDRFRPGTKTKFQTFHYPARGGYGAIPDAFYNAVSDSVRLRSRVTGLTVGADNRVSEVLYEQDGREYRQPVDRLVSTLPMTVFTGLLGHKTELSFQKVNAVYLHVAKSSVSDNHWLYFMDESSSVNRLVEFKHMSDADTDPTTTVVCAEVTRDVSDPVAAVVEDVVSSGLISRDDIRDSRIITEPFAYPRYSLDYPNAVATYRSLVETIGNVDVIGRAAQFEHLEVDDIVGSARGLALRMRDLSIPRLEVTGMKPTAIAVVVLAWNNYEDTAECLTSVLKMDGAPFEVILVDNGSTDGTTGRVREQFPGVTIIENGANLGVPAGYNVGFRHALERGAGNVLMLNNDTVVDQYLLTELLAASVERDAGILVPIVCYYDRRSEVWSSGARYRRFPPALVFERRVFQATAGYYELEGALSCGLLITRRAFEQAGLFDDSFRFLWDDHDFSHRVRDASLRILQVPKARMWHKVSRTTRPGTSTFWEVAGESGAIYYRRHASPAFPQMFVHLGYFLLREIVYKRQFRFLGPYLRGVWRGARKPLHPVPRYKDGQSFPG